MGNYESKLATPILKLRALTLCKAFCHRPLPQNWLRLTLELWDGTPRRYLQQTFIGTCRCAIQSAVCQLCQCHVTNHGQVSQVSQLCSTSLLLRRCFRKAMGECNNHALLDVLGLEGCSQVLILKIDYPLVNVYITMENHRFFMGKSNYKWCLFQ